MTSNRLEAFSDGVIAILITIMVLELTIPHAHHDQLADLWHLRHIFLSYVVSFVYLAIYWNNHHHVLYLTERVTGGVLWANMHLLFWLSLVPFATGWMGENSFASTPTAVYGVVLLMAAVAYFILVRAIIRSQGTDSLLAQAIGSDRKGKISLVFYAVGHPAGAGRAVGVAGHLHAGRGHLARPRPAHRDRRPRLRERGRRGLPGRRRVNRGGAAPPCRAALLQREPDRRHRVVSVAAQGLQAQAEERAGGQGLTSSSSTQRGRT